MRSILHLSLLFVAVANLAGADTPPAHSLFTIGDSTMANYRLIPQEALRGWGQMLPMYFKPELHVENHAASGRSTKSFIHEGRWKTVIERVKAGDFMIIQFGHNDEKVNKAGVGVPANGEFKENLTRFIREVREHGATPILATSVARRVFDKDGELQDTHHEYVTVVRALAAEQKVPLLDLEKRTFELLKKLGPDKSKRLFMQFAAGEFPTIPAERKDDTHFNAYGASMVCDLAVLEIKTAVPELAKLLVETAAP